MENRKLYLLVSQQHHLDECHDWWAISQIEYGSTQQDVAKVFGVSQSVISQQYLLEFAQEIDL